MDNFITIQNIQHFTSLLQKETDSHRRQTLERLLAEEKVKLVQTKRAPDLPSDS